MPKQLLTESIWSTCRFLTSSLLERQLLPLYTPSARWDLRWITPAHRHWPDVGEEPAERVVWRPEDSEVSEGDMGLRGVATHGRAGGREVCTRVIIDHGGILFSVEGQRYSHPCSDKGPLLDLCDPDHCVITESDRISAADTPHDHWISAVKRRGAAKERALLSARLTASLLTHARQSEFAVRVPTDDVATLQATISRVGSRRWACWALGGGLSWTQTYARRGDRGNREVRHWVELKNIHKQIVFYLNKKTRGEVPVFETTSVTLSGGQNLRQHAPICFAQKETASDLLQERATMQVQLPLYQKLLVIKKRRHRRNLLDTPRRYQIPPCTGKRSLVVMPVSHQPGLPLRLWCSRHRHRRQLQLSKSPTTLLFLCPDSPSTLEQLPHLRAGLLQYVGSTQEYQDAKSKNASPSIWMVARGNDDNMSGMSLMGGGNGGCRRPQSLQSSVPVWG